MWGQVSQNEQKNCQKVESFSLCYPIFSQEMKIFKVIISQKPALQSKNWDKIFKRIKEANNSTVKATADTYQGGIYKI